MRHGTFLMAALMLAGCGKPAAPTVDGAWIRLPAVPGRPAAGYFTLHGGATDATLIAVVMPGAARAELHQSMAGGMRPLASVRVAAGTTVTFAPGGRHVMVFDVDPRLRPGAATPLTLSFAGGRRLSVQARLVGPGDQPPAP